MIVSQHLGLKFQSIMKMNFNFLKPQMLEEFTLQAKMLFILELEPQKKLIAF
mgnify:CR=1 FL=1